MFIDAASAEMERSQAASLYDGDSALQLRAKLDHALAENRKLRVENDICVNFLCSYYLKEDGMHTSKKRPQTRERCIEVAKRCQYFAGMMT